MTIHVYDTEKTYKEYTNIQSIQIYGEEARLYSSTGLCVWSATYGSFHALVVYDICRTCRPDSSEH